MLLFSTVEVKNERKIANSGRKVKAERLPER